MFDFIYEEIQKNSDYLKSVFILYLLNKHSEGLVSSLVKIEEDIYIGHYFLESNGKYITLCLIIYGEEVDFLMKSDECVYENYLSTMGGYPIDKKIVKINPPIYHQLEYIA